MNVAYDDFKLKIDGKIMHRMIYINLILDKRRTRAGARELEQQLT